MKTGKEWEIEFEERRKAMLFSSPTLEDLIQDAQADALRWAIEIINPIDECAGDVIYEKVKKLESS